MDLGLAGKWAAVTGASEGIGLACAEMLASEGCNVHLVARTPASLESARERIQSRHAVNTVLHALDLSSTQAVLQLASSCADIDILVNNAGAIPRQGLLESQDEVWRRSWDLKVFGYINLTREIYRSMCARGRGVIVNVIGIAGEAPNPKSIIGTAGNAALMALSRALGTESVDHGVRVVGVNPGLVRTSRTQSLSASGARNGDGRPWDALLRSLPFGRMAEPAEIASVVAFLASERASYVSGTIVTVDGGAVQRR